MSRDQQVDEDIHLKEQEIQQNKIQEVAKKENESKRLQQEEGQQKIMESFVKAKHGKRNMHHIICIIWQHVFFMKSFGAAVESNHNTVCAI